MTQQVATKNTIGIIGTSFGLIALAIALFHFWAGPFDKHPSLEEVVADTAVGIKERVFSKIKGDKSVKMSPPKKYSIDDNVDIVTIACGFFAIMLSAISFIKREDKRASGTAVLLGVGAIAFQLFTVVLGTIVVVILVVAVLGSLGLS
jgi:hypothetical protein